MIGYLLTMFSLAALCMLGGAYVLSWRAARNHALETFRVCNTPALLVSVSMFLVATERIPWNAYMRFLGAGVMLFACYGVVLWGAHTFCAWFVRRRNPHVYITLLL